MTERELEKEAEEFENSNSYFEAEGSLNRPSHAKRVCRVSIRETYLAAAIPREYRIAELERELKTYTESAKELVKELLDLKSSISSAKEVEHRFIIREKAKKFLEVEE